MWLYVAGIFHCAVDVGTAVGAVSHAGGSQMATLVTLPSPSLSSPHTSAVPGSRQYGPHREGEPEIDNCNIVVPVLSLMHRWQIQEKAPLSYKLQ